jgi:hypothetical protein
VRTPGLKPGRDYSQGILSLLTPFEMTSIHALQQNVSLFDHLVGDGEHCRRHLNAERPSRLEVDDKLEFDRLRDTARSAGFAPLRILPV